jgi:hypothetical protein
MKNNVFKVTAGNKFQAVIVFLRSQLGIKASDPLVSPARRGAARRGLVCVMGDHWSLCIRLRDVLRSRKGGSVIPAGAEAALIVVRGWA